MDLLPPGWQDIGAQGLVVLGVIMIMLGWLVPRWIVRRMLADKDAQIAVKDETIDRLTKALQDLTVTAHTAPIALRTLAKEAERPGGD